MLKDKKMEMKMKMKKREREMVLPGECSYPVRPGSGAAPISGQGERKTGEVGIVIVVLGYEVVGFNSGILTRSKPDVY